MDKSPNATAPSIIPSGSVDQREFTARVLMSIANDVATLHDASDRIATQIRALALEYNVG